MKYNINKLSLMSETELVDVNGGGWPVVVGIVIVCGAVFYLGVSNGYNDTKRGK